MLPALELGSTTKTKGCSVTFPSPAEHLHSGSGVQGPTPHSPILKNKLFFLLGNQGKEQLCWDKGRAADCILILLAIDGFH